ncbi:MAG TPA: sugar ABC transporter substrate-binding protein [Bacillota bacterium]|nr:sugar ABC transporter substrate-binding protein [Bacillota bacterium]
MRKHKFRLVSVLLIAALVALALVGCGGGSGSSDDSSVKKGEAASSGIDFAAKAAAAVKASSDTFQGPTEAAGAIPSGIKIAVIPSDGTLSGCVAPCKGVMSAAEKIGWEAQMYDGGGSSATQNKSILNAISWGADVIMCAAVDPKGIQQGLKAAEEAGVLMVSGSNGIDDPNPVLQLGEGQLNFAFDVGPDYAAVGSAIADWIINDAGNGGEVAVFGDKEFPSVEALQVGLLDELNKSDMKISDVQYFTGSQVGDTLNRQVVSYLTSHPECKYVFAPFDPAAASMVEGLNQANMTDVKVIGVLGISQNIEYIRSGNIQVATGAYDNEYMGWAVVDQVIRHLNGKDYAAPRGENLPYIVLDKTNLPDQGKNWVASFDYQSEFLKLWK